MNILIVGYGNIGKHIHKEFEILKPEIYDINIREHCDMSIIDNLYDAAFICVPTESLNDGSCDVSIVYKSVMKINADIIIIKSTVPPGTTEFLQKQYPAKNIIFSPEYYGVTQHCKEEPGFVVLGGEKEICDKAAQLYYKVKNGYYKILLTDTKTAELAKYMLNCYLALKVTFCNEFADVARDIGVSYTALREIFVADERIGNSHTFVYNDKPYYDSHCFNKDIPAFIQFAKPNVPLISEMDKINKRRKYGASSKPIY